MDIGKTLNYLFAGFVTVAIISVIVSKNSTTPGVLQSLGVALSTMFASIVAPVANNTAQAAASHPPSGATGSWPSDPSNLTAMPSTVTPTKPSPHDASSATTQNQPAG